ncbi:ABC transporter ATP-binding protein [Aquamicrobium sp. LC103]|uniref:ABC transporter ATP-binding protein n=1 Tax=Aquamicrobium sp. LC103 TaxID=1120658 RepID=UPI00063E8F41|nr:ABC transporter ATP-binding protein [Aquamicrobium sp. LC103]TKT74437.1 ABC transporter ATP-binding protein [Aquamicrobium sp. LC103]
MTETAPSPLISLRDLQVTFGLIPEPVVKSFDLDIARGEVVALVGESGSGKSVTAKSIMRLVEFSGARIASGEAWLYDNHGGRTDLFRLNQNEMRSIRGSRISMIFQDPMTSLNPVLTIGFQLREAVLRHATMSKADADRICLEALRQVRISEPEQRLKQYPHELSGGMRQRVMIAMALALKPDLLIADEPTTALDVTVQAEILALLKTIQRETGMSVLFITHDMGVVAEIADRVVVMLRGDRVETGDVRTIFEAPTHDYTRALLAAAPKLGAGADAAPAFEPVTDDAPVLEVDSLVVRYPVRKGLLQRVAANVHAVEDVSFKVHRRETLAIVGESGCGKSTTAKALMNLIEPTSGAIRLHGRDIASLTAAQMMAARADIQMIFQDPYASLNPRMTVEQIIAEPLEIHQRGDAASRRAQVTELIERVGLPIAAAKRYPHNFSGGQRQRICIARALALRPSVIIADEPVSALDVSIQAQILALIEEIQRDFDVGILFISHDMAVVEKVSDRIAVMHLGEIVEIGPRDAVLRDPRHAYTRQLLDAVPVAHPALRKARQMEARAMMSPIRPLGADHPTSPMREVSHQHFVRADA